MHRVQLKWSPADGGQVDVIRNGHVIATTADDGHATTTSEPEREHSPTRSVKQTQAIARMKSPSTSNNRPIGLLEDI